MGDSFIEILSAQEAIRETVTLVMTFRDEFIEQGVDPKEALTASHRMVTDMILQSSKKEDVK